MNSVWAGIQMGGLLVIIEYAFFNLYQAIVGQSYIQFIWIEPLYRYLFCIALIIVPGFINYYVLFKHDRYLIYFKEFRKLSKSKSLKYKYLSVGFVLFIILFLVCSFYVLMLRFGN